MSVLAPSTTPASAAQNNSITVLPEAGNVKYKTSHIKPTPRQRALINSPADTIFFGGARGGGKAQPFDAKILSPSGFRLMGNIQVGDIISGSNGSHQQVIGVYDQGEQDIYEIAFSDGAKTQCTLDHLWNIKQTCSLSENRNGATGQGAQKCDWNVWTFGQIKGWLDYKENAKDGDCIHNLHLLIPLCKPISITNSYNYNMRCIGPYTLGVLLGTGCLVRDNGISLTTSSRDIIQRISTHYNWDCGNHTNEYFCNDVSLLDDLNKIGFVRYSASWQFVPEYYKMAPADARLEILRGLLDIDGTVDSCGHVSYHTVSKRLAQDVQWIVWSLGGAATVTPFPVVAEAINGNQVDCHVRYGVSINTPFNDQLFYLPCKRDRYSSQDNSGCGELHRHITGYRYIGKKSARCIAVSNPDSLYITDDFVITHNTYGIGVLILHRALKYGKPFKAIFFRRTNPELEDAIDQFSDLFGAHAIWIASKNIFKFWNGATLKMGFLDDARDLIKYQGRQYSLISFDEVTNFDDYNIIERMRGSLRSAHGIPTQLIMSGNPGGPLHNRLKMDFIDPYPKGEVLIPDGFSKKLGRMLTRCFIPSKLDDNPYLRDTEYGDNLRKSGTPEQVKQWLDGNWDITQHAAFADIFDYDIHVIRPFRIPTKWRITKSYDYGSSRPWGCVWFAISDGSDFWQNDTWRPTIPGDIFAIYELYGWNGRPNEGNKESIQSQAEKINRVEELALDGYTISKSIADSAIFTSMSGAYCISDDFADHGVYWERCNKYPGSREQGYVLMRERLLASIERDGNPGIYWSTRCNHSIRTIPLMQMDKDGSDRVATGSSSEDHLYDLTAYLLLSQDMGEAGSGATLNY